MCEATVGVVVGRGSERGSSMHGMLANGSGHAYETEELNRTIAAASVPVLVGSAASVFVLADMAVRMYEGARSDVEAVQLVELEVDAVKEPDE